MKSQRSNCRKLYVTLLLVLVAACATEQTRHGDEVARLDNQIAELREQNDRLIARNQLLEEQLEQSMSRQEALRRELARLEQKANASSRGPAGDRQQQERIAQLQRTLEAARAGEQQARDEMQRLEREIEELSAEKENLILEYIYIEELASQAMVEPDMAAAAIPSEDSARYEWLVEDHKAAELNIDFDELTKSREPTEMTLFFGTNRARADPDLADYLRQFFGAVLLLILYFLVAWLTKRYIKTRYQRRVTLTARIIAALGIVIFLVIGSARVLQMRQAERVNPVQYGPLRLETDPGELPFELGTCTVSIPPVHERGKVELPVVAHLELRFDPQKHFVLSGITPSDTEGFFSALQERIEQASDRDLFVFVHGFHNTFQDAAFRTAQIAFDLGFDGAPVFFSWPSQGTVLNYTEDENNVEVAVSDLKLFLEMIRENSGADRIHLIAHSMGSRALTKAVHQISLGFEGRPAFNELILAAPDIDAKVLSQMAETMATAVDRVTLYASSKDEALSASRFVHGQTYQRAGETEPDPLVSPWIETIDVSWVTSGHSYIADNGRVLTDLKDLLSSNRELNEQIATKIPLGDGHFWEMRGSRRDTP